MIWYIQTCAVWAAGVGLAFAVALLLSWLVPAAHPVERLARLKWSLYTSCALLPALLVAMAYSAVSWAAAYQRAWARGDWAVPIPDAFVAAIVYGLIWATGIVCQPYAAKRSWRRAFDWLGVWGAAVWLTYGLLFPGGSLADLE